VNNHELSKIDFELIGDAIMKRLFAGRGPGEVPETKSTPSKRHFWLCWRARRSERCWTTLRPMIRARLPSSG
jgi:hypothetical protein